MQMEGTNVTGAKRGKAHGAPSLENLQPVLRAGNLQFTVGAKCAQGNVRWCQTLVNMQRLPRVWKRQLVLSAEKNGCMLSLMAFSADTNVNKGNVNVNGPKNISTRENAI